MRYQVQPLALTMTPPEAFRICLEGDMNRSLYEEQLITLATTLNEPDTVFI